MSERVKKRGAPKRTHFGQVFEDLLVSRKYSQSSFARECQRRGFRVDSQNIIQQSVSNWLTGYRGCPRQIPLYVERILAPTDAEWLEFAVAYTYGQTLTPGEWAEREERKVTRSFREFVRGVPEGRGVPDSGSQSAGGAEGGNTEGGDSTAL